MAPDHPSLNRLLWPANPREVETHGGTVWTTCAACGQPVQPANYVANWSTRGGVYHPSCWRQVTTR